MAVKFNEGQKPPSQVPHPTLHAMRRRHFTKLAMDRRELEISWGNKGLHTNFTKPEEFLPQISKLICSKNDNSRMAGGLIVDDLGMSNPEELARRLPKLLPLLRKERKFAFCSTHRAVLNAIRDVAKYDALLLPPPAELFDSIVAGAKQPLAMFDAEYFTEATDAIKDGMMAAVRDKKRRRKALELLCGISATRPKAFAGSLFEIMGEAEKGTNQEYLLICKVVRNSLDQGIRLPYYYSLLLLKGIDERSKKARKEGKELAGRIRWG